MWGFTTQPGLAITVLDFTKDLSSLSAGLFGLVLLSAGLIALTAIRYHLSQQTTSATEPAPAATGCRAAA
jgi:hypothetical protein